MLSIDAWLDEKPYREVYDGTIHEKVIPQLAHGIVAAELVMQLGHWAGQRGAVAVELRVYLSPGVTLVPDVAFISDERLAALSEEEREKPPFAPDIAVEVRSPEDREANVRRKTDLYLRHGAQLVLDVDPQERTVRASSRSGERTLVVGDTIADSALPDLRIPVAAIFASL
jgi:Uma2 family endonuclease